MPPTPLHRSQLSAALKRLGVRPGDVLLTHTSLGSLGPVEGGATTFIAALQDALTSQGTLVMPAFAYNFQRIYEPIEPYDPQTTPAHVGLVAETFRQQPHVLRSRRPTHSFAAWGARAKEIVDCDDPQSVLGPLRRAVELGAKVLLVGCGFTSLTLLHLAEERAELPYLPIANWGQLGWRPTALIKDDRGRAQCVAVPNVPGCSRHFTVAEALADTQGLLRRGRLGAAATILVDAAALLDLITNRLRAEPAFLLCPPGECPACDQRHVVFEPQTDDARAIMQFMVDVVAGCGCRLAGSAGEEQAAKRIARRMHEVGLEDVETLEFPLRAWQPGFSRIECLAGERWEAGASFPVSHSPPTRGKFIEGRTRQVESFVDLDKLADLGGRIAVLWDGYGESRADFRRLMQAGCKGLILVDRRFSHGDVVAEGVPARWLDEFTTPALSIPYTLAQRWFRAGDRQCRMQVGGRTVPARSTVVSGEIPGTLSDAILLCGHHDTTANSAAPDDNLSGVATVLQAAAILARRKRRPQHTIRVCSFGAEEQLSEGARWYALESGRAEDVRFVINADSVGARCGTTGVFLTGGESLTRWFRRQSQRAPLQFKPVADLCPFSDQFPFNCRGVPSLWLYRQTITAGRHFHHTVRDAFDAISCNYLAELAQFVAGLVTRLAARDKFPFSTQFSPKLRADITDARRNWLE